jgi:hypothetical protein
MPRCIPPGVPPRVVVHGERRWARSYSANATFATLSMGGQFSIFDFAAGHLLADTAGWFTAATGPGTGTAVLAGLVIAPASSPVPYNRSSWGDWIDADHDCQDTRAEVLITQAVPATVTLSANGRTVTGGQWLDPYTNQVVVGPSNIDIDHMVPLGNAHRSGAWAWDATIKRAYYNDLTDTDHLLAVTDSVNQSKDDRAPKPGSRPTPAIGAATPASGPRSRRSRPSPSLNPNTTRSPRCSPAAEAKTREPI